MRKELLLCLILLLAVFAHAQTPNTISFQGNLTTPGTENPIADGTYSMDFELFDDVNNPMWSETQPTVQVTNGLINVLLGSVTPLQIDDFYQPLYLQITIDGETLTPQIALQAVPFAQTSKAVVGTDSIVFRILDQKAGIVDQTNTALGFFSFTKEQGAGFFNEAFGVGALENNNGGSQNVAIGSYSLGSNTNGNTNIAIGYQALNASTTSSNNVAVGSFALENNTDGFQNVGIGRDALLTNTTGQSNTAIGYGADVASGGLTNATAIGANTLVSQSNSLVLGNSVNVGIGTSSPGKKLSVVGDIQASDSVKADVFAYNSPKQKYYAIAPVDYELLSTSATIYKYVPTNGIYAAVTGGTGNVAAMMAPLNLPDGAIITGFKAGVYDGSANDLTVQLMRHGMGSISSPVALATSNATSGSGGFSEISATGLSIPVNNELYAYSMKFNTYDNEPSVLVIYVTRISYIVPGP
ncbi:MAG: hypothetical protein KI791_15920 [Cyclobacteriaceae bacterium]|nr:hypothetical protein [Cyclobacteriaceae bacterium SS2]